jgi:hypothetical protein
VEYGIDVRIVPQTVPSLYSLENYCYKKIQPKVNLDPSYLDVPKHKLSAYLRVFGLLTQFGLLSTGDRPNYGLDEFRGTRAVGPKNERQTVNLGLRLSSLELRASIARKRCRSLDTSEHCNWCEWV